MFDLKKFLRIEISGYVCILYTALFITCLFILFKPEFASYQSDSGFWFKASLAAIPVALILGFIIHQLSISLLNPFCEYRTFFEERPVLISLENRLRSLPKYYLNILEGVDKNGLFDALAGLPSSKNPGYSEYLRGEISRRYSYYYARIDAGIFAPVLGLFLSFFICGGVFLLNYPNCAPSFADVCWPRLFFLWASLIYLFIQSISIGIIWYCRKLIREIDILECALLVENYDYWLITDILKGYEAGIRNTVNPTK